MHALIQPEGNPFIYEILRNQIGSTNPKKEGLSLVTLKFSIAFLTFKECLF